MQTKSHFFRILNNRTKLRTTVLVFKNKKRRAKHHYICTLDVVFRQISTLLEDSEAVVYGLRDRGSKKTLKQHYDAIQHQRCAGVETTQYILIIFQILLKNDDFSNFGQN